MLTQQRTVHASQADACCSVTVLDVHKQSYIAMPLKSDAHILYAGTPS